MVEELPLIQVTSEEYERAVAASQYRQTAQERAEERNKQSTAKRKSGPPDGPLAFLKTTNDWLEDVPIRITAAYNNFIGNGEDLVQSKVDIFCAWLAWKVNIAVERKRQVVLQILYDQYKSTAGGKVAAVAKAIQDFCNDPIGAIGSLAGAIFGPVFAVFKWIVELGKEILRLASNLARIMAVLPPSPPNPHINYDKFKLKIKSISMAEVISDPYNLPPPEVMFPEPQKPFTKESFTKGFEKATASLKSSKKKYVLSEEDKKTLAGFNTLSLSDVISSETNVDIS
jgi:hypothetical protein